MSPDREEAATGIAPDAVLDEMQRATQNLREQAWKMTSGPTTAVDDEAVAS